MSKDNIDTERDLCGKTARLHWPLSGYHTGKVVGQNGCRFLIQLGNGVIVLLYDDEFEID